MRIAAYLFLLAFLGVALSGCGTVCNLVGGIYHPESEPRVFGGFLKDYEIITGVTKPFAGAGVGTGKGAAILVAAALVVLAVDPMVSLVADVATLPITVPLQNSRIAREQERNGNEHVPIGADPANSTSSVESPNTSPRPSSGSLPIAPPGIEVSPPIGPVTCPAWLKTSKETTSSKLWETEPSNLASLDHFLISPALPPFPSSPVSPPGIDVSPPMSPVSSPPWSDGFVAPPLARISWPG